MCQCAWMCVCEQERLCVCLSVCHMCLQLLELGMCIVYRVYVYYEWKDVYMRRWVSLLLCVRVRERWMLMSASHAEHLAVKMRQPRCHQVHCGRRWEGGESVFYAGARRRCGHTKAQLSVTDNKRSETTPGTICQSRSEFIDKLPLFACTFLPAMLEMSGSSR